MKKYLTALILVGTLVFVGASRAQAYFLCTDPGSSSSCCYVLDYQNNRVYGNISDGPNGYFCNLAIASGGNPNITTFLSSTGITSNPSTRTETPTSTAPISSLFSKALSFGQTGVDIKTLQTLLVQKGFLSADSVTGYYGSATTAAVKRLQESNGIVSDGTIVGPQTKAVLTSTASVDQGTRNPTTSVVDTTKTTTTSVREGGPISKDCAAVATAITVTVDSTTPAARTYRAGTLGHDAGHFKITSNCPVTVTKLIATPNYSVTKLTPAKPPVSLYYFYDGKVLLGAGKTSISRSTGYFSLGAGQSKIITVKADMTPQKSENQFQINLGVSSNGSGSTVFTSPFANWF